MENPGERLQQLEGAVEALQQWAMHQQGQPAVADAAGGVKPPKPKPYHGGPNPDMWIFSLSVYFAAVGLVQDAQRVAYATALLRGAAMEWWRFKLLHQPPTSWDDFSRALVSQFMPVAAERLARDRLIRLRQDGSVQRYIADFRRLLLRVTDISNADATHRFIQGLRPNLAREVNIRDPDSLDTAMAIAQRADHYNFRSRLPYTLSTAGRAAIAPVPMEVDAMEAVATRQFQGYCRNCGRWGHKASRCRGRVSVQAGTNHHPRGPPHGGASQRVPRRPGQGQ